jgi:hypothetical protein
MPRWFFVGLCLALPSFAGHAADGAGAWAAALQISGVYPHLAVFNEHGECGIGAVVPWAGRLWYITYPPHFRTGSTDKLYELDEQMNLTIRPESVGGTHANRMIHRESNQLIIGRYFIDAQRNVRAADVHKLVGRMTATARHLTDPANKVYFVDMEGPVWEVDVRTLEPRRLFVKAAPGWHGKGAYTGQGVLVIANNGEVPGGGLEKMNFELPVERWPHGPEDAGALAEWNGQPDSWRVISRRQHTEVTGPGGIQGAQDEGEPIWSTGWDKRSVLVHVRDAKTGSWSRYRLPKSSHTYDPKHGWYTEWPRIREIAPAAAEKPARLMMTMHGMMFDFPKSFAAGNTGGIRPIASHLRYIPDFCHWNGRVVLATDETSIMQNPLAGVSQSNLWFGTAEALSEFGPAAGWGGVWLDDAVKAGEPSDPYLFAGFAKRVLFLSQSSDASVLFNIEVDDNGDGQWRRQVRLIAPPHQPAFYAFPADAKGQWVRLTADHDTTATAYFHYLSPRKAGPAEREKIFDSLAAVDADQASTALLRPAKDGTLLLLNAPANGTEWLYSIDQRLRFTKVDDGGATAATVHKLNDVPASPFGVDEASVYVDAGGGKRYRLPKGDSAFDAFVRRNGARWIREVESERNLVNVHGTFYEIPRGAANAAGAADWKNIKPIASHRFGIVDYCTWRGLLVLAGAVAPDAKPDGHFFRAPGGVGPGLWFGAIDDLWRLGKPVGRGGPWNHTSVEAGKPSDPYLMLNYDRKTMSLAHDGDELVTFTVEVDPTNSGQWHAYKRTSVGAGVTATCALDDVAAYWVRVTVDKPCKATATFIYE